MAYGVMEHRSVGVHCSLQAVGSTEAGGRHPASLRLNPWDATFTNSSVCPSRGGTGREGEASLDHVVSEHPLVAYPHR